MSLQEAFKNIVANPRIYNAAIVGKDNYLIGAKPACDRCGLGDLDTYVSSVSTPKVDLCTTCFKTLKSAAAIPIGPPQNVVQHTLSQVSMEDAGDDSPPIGIKSMR